MRPIPHLHNDAALQPDTLANDDVGSNYDIWTDHGGWVDSGGRVDKDVALLDVGVLRRQSQERRFLLSLHACVSSVLQEVFR